MRFRDLSSALDNIHDKDEMLNSDLQDSQLLSPSEGQGSPINPYQSRSSRGEQMYSVLDGGSDRDDYRGGRRRQQERGG